YFLNALLSLATRFNLQGESLMTPSRISSFSPFSKLLPTSDNWLASLVKTLVNASLWKKTCSACAVS
ncbi:MAG: hypothetical protein ACRCS6_04655, partial [Turicibacter sp.]